MTYIIIGFGIAIALAGISIIVNPALLFGYMRRNVESLSLHILAVVGRIVLGALLLVTASASKYPLLIECIGWLSLFAALTLTLIGRGNFIRFISWALKFTGPLGRVGGIFALLFGAFLVYAYL